jgi:hypothetical protein
MLKPFDGYSVQMLASVTQGLSAQLLFDQAKFCGAHRFLPGSKSSDLLSMASQRAVRPEPDLHRTGNAAGCI